MAGNQASFYLSLTRRRHYANGTRINNIGTLRMVTLKGLYTYKYMISHFMEAYQPFINENQEPSAILGAVQTCLGKGIKIVLYYLQISVSRLPIIFYIIEKNKIVIQQNRSMQLAHAPNPTSPGGRWVCGSYMVSI